MSAQIRDLIAEGRRLYARLYAAVLDSGERRVVLSSEGDAAPTTDLLVWAGNNLPVLLDALDEAEEARARVAELEAHQPPLLLLGKEFEARAAIDRARKLHQPENGCDNPVHTVPDATCPQCCDYCQCCGEAMPCATIRAIDGEDSRFPTPKAGDFTGGVR